MTGKHYITMVMFINYVVAILRQDFFWFQNYLFKVENYWKLETL